MARYTNVTIIYNPNSTGSSQQLAEQTAAALRQADEKLLVKTIATKHAGHAETLAYDLARKSAHPLIVSASGDGGYHEVVNGLMKAQNGGAIATSGLVPAGNANDHYHSLHKDDFVVSVVAGKERRIDLLKLVGTVHGKPIERYAHSYIGFGITPNVGHELNKTKLNPLQEMLSVIKGLLRPQSVHLLVNNTVQTYDSLTFSNVPRMAKVLTLSPKAKIDDGKFEVAALYRHHRLRHGLSLLRATTTGLTDTKQCTHFQLQTLRPTLVQLDGEITTLDAGSHVEIAIDHAILRCVI